MVCPHCGSEAGNTSFCPSCSRLVRSPLLGMHRELAASRGKTYGAEAIAAAAATRASDLASAKERRVAAAATPGSAATPERGVITEAMRKALERRERKARQRERDEEDDGAASAAVRARHSDDTHTIEDTSAPPPLPQTRPTPVEPTPERFPRPAPITILALLNALAGAAFLLIASVLWDGDALRPVSFETAPHYLAGLVGVVHLLAALGLRGLHPFGRFFQKVIAFLCLFLVPFGTIYGLILFAYFRSPGVTLSFSGRSPRSMNAKEIAAWQKSQKFAPVMAVVFFVLAILPALAAASFAVSGLPSVLATIRGFATSAGTGTGDTSSAPTVDPDVQVFEDVQAVMRAQAAYASLGGGLYDRLECVTEPAACLGTADPRNAAQLLDPRYLVPQRNEYVYRLVLGRRPATRPAGASATGVDAYAYVATHASGSGLAICGDSTGALVQIDIDVAARLRTAKCPVEE